MKKIVLFLILCVICLSGCKKQQEYNFYAKGMGIVTGLNGTGDKSELTKKAFKQLTEKMGLQISDKDFQSHNIAVVWVSAVVKESHKPGDKIDVKLSTLYDCESLEGGILAGTPLNGPRAIEDNFYAWAVGKIQTKKAHPTSGKIKKGAIIIKDIEHFLRKVNKIDTYEITK